MFFWNSKHLSEEQVNESREFFNFGWAPLMKLLLNDHNFNIPHQFIQNQKRDYDLVGKVKHPLLLILSRYSAIRWTSSGAKMGS